MTIREYLMEKKQLYGRLFGASMFAVIAFQVIAFLTNLEWIFVGVVIGSILFIAAVFSYKYRVRCPKCNGNIGANFNYFGNVQVLFFKPVMYCPYCAVALDSEHNT